MKFGLGSDTIEQIHRIFASFSNIEVALLYGSRAKGNYRPGSDIDLSLKGQNIKINEVSIALDDLNLPYEFDLSIYDHIENPEFLDHIKRVGIEFYNRDKHADAAKRDRSRKHFSQSEQALELKLIKQLNTLGYANVTIRNEQELLANLKTQLEIHNNTQISEGEFERVKIHLNKGNVFERAKILRDKMMLRRDDGTASWIEFIDTREWCMNQYQVTNQISQEGSYKNRYDVTLLINGLPLVQIELKRRGLELREAFNQLDRYQKHSFWSGSGLFQYVQIFVISNGENTKYYANNKKLGFKQTFYWADKKNKIINQLDQFAKEFLEKCHLSKMISKYIVLNETDKILMVLRPYQYYAVEALVDKVKHGRSNGYVWHTTGSGKTLTSFKAAQILTNIPKVHKVVFVVDRRDLDYQTNLEFNAFSKGSVDGTNNTRELVKQFSDDDTPLIVTTIQKLDNAIKNTRYRTQMEPLKDKRIVFIFDECHRSQFGETHDRITKYFNRYQMFGFTGTPIFPETATKNELGKRTTGDLFGESLHEYVITDAIRDENVLKFSVEYVGRYKEKEGTNAYRDIEVEAIDTVELMESRKRLEPIVDYIIDNHDRKTHNREFTAMFCVSSIDVLKKYYELFRAKKAEGLHDLKIATIFSFSANEDSKTTDDFSESNFDLEGDMINQHSRDVLESYIGDYNQMFGSNYTTKDSKSFYNYYNDIGKRVREKEIDILLVVNMFLTGFDSKSLNTLYVDKNLKHHGLIQAFSRTNRILGEKKSQGNIVCFRNLKVATDKAIQIFSNIYNIDEKIIIDPYEDYVVRINQAIEKLLMLVPTPDNVNDLISEEDELKFVLAFRAVMRLMNIIKTYSEFSYEDTLLSMQVYENFASKYYDLRDKVISETEKEKVSILEDVDFELELLHKDKVNVTYILSLLGDLKTANEKDKAKKQEAIMNMISVDHKLHSKKELIEKFILENMPEIKNASDLEEEFKNYWDDEKIKAFEELCQGEGLDKERVEEIIGEHLFTGHKPFTSSVVEAMNEKPKILGRKKMAKKALTKIMKFIEVFITDAPE